MKTEVVALPPRKISERVRGPYRRYVETNAEILKEVERLLPRADRRYQRFLTHRMDPSDLAGASMRDIDYRFGVYGSMGRTTPGISSSDIAARGASDALEPVLNDWIKRGRPGSPAVRCKKVFR